MSRKIDFIRVMDEAVVWVEGLVAALLVFLGAWGAVSLVVAVARLVGAGVDFKIDRYLAVIDVTLIVFVIVELFRIAIAYLRHEDVIPTVLEAGLVAVARKLVAFNTEAAPATVLMNAAALTLLLLAVGITWYLLAKRNPRLLPDVDAPKEDGSA